MTELTFFYVCDQCGTLRTESQVPADGEWTCETCASHRAWEFPPERTLEAHAHAAHIARGIGKGGIFRHARAV